MRPLAECRARFPAGRPRAWCERADKVVFTARVSPLLAGVVASSRRHISPPARGPRAGRDRDRRSVRAGSGRRFASVHWGASQARLALVWMVTLPDGGDRRCTRILHRDHRHCRGLGRRARWSGPRGGHLRRVAPRPGDRAQRERPSRASAGPDCCLSSSPARTSVEHTRAHEGTLRLAARPATSPAVDEWRPMPFRLAWPPLSRTRAAARQRGNHG